MKRKTTSRLLAILLAAALAVQMAPLSVLAADSNPIPGGEVAKNQPWTYGHRFADLIDWDEDVDPYAAYLRAEVPLQSRIAPYKPTQANPDLEYGPQLLWMTGDYGNSFINGTTHNNVFSEQILTYWQYIDVYSPWHGAATSGTPRGLWTELQSGFTWASGRMFDFGVINIPNAAYTNAAHKNGALSLACIYFDDGNRAGQPADEMILQKDENGRYVMADVMIEMAEYYGFDGWFFNYEANLHSTSKRTATETVTELKKAMKQITDAGLFTQMYSTLRTNGTFSGWHSIVDDDVWSFMVDDNNPELDGSVGTTFVNYDWSSSTRSLSAYTLPYVKNKLDAKGLTADEQEQWAYDHLYYGVEVSQGEMSYNGGHNSVWNFVKNKTQSGNTLNANVYANSDSTDPTEQKKLRGSVALFTADEFTHRRISDWGKGRLHELDDYQWIPDERERMYFSGPFSDPSNTGRAPAGYGRPEIGLSEFYNRDTGAAVTSSGSGSNRDIKAWPGVADFISERSAASGTSFYSNFNTGRGLEYRVDGAVSNSEKWSNVSIQDIMPTWQWWIESNGSGDSKLSVDWDYGSKFKKRDFRTASQSGSVHTYGNELPLGYTSVGAYTGGNSIVLYGDLNGANEWHAFKTELDVNSDSKAGVTFQKTSTDTAQMGLKLYFTDGTDATLPIANTADKGGWITSEVNLSAHAGKKIAAISFVFNGTASSYQMNIGNITISDIDDVVSEPANVSLEAVYETGEVKVAWDKEDYDIVKQYNIYADYGTGEEFIGGIYGSQFYVKSVKDGLKAIKVRAVGADGKEGPATVVKYSFDDNVSNIVVKEFQTTAIADAQGNSAYGSLTQNLNEGLVEASWNAPKNSADFDGYEMAVTINNSKNKTEYTTAVPKSTTSGVVEVTDDEGNYLNDGEEYTLRIYTTKDGVRLGEPICYTGNLKDTYSKPYDGVLRFNSANNTMRIGNPTSKDWWKIEVRYNGNLLTIPSNRSLASLGNGWRGVARINDGVSLTSKTSGIVSITLTDYSYNKSTVEYDLSFYRGNDTDTEIHESGISVTSLDLKMGEEPVGFNVWLGTYQFETVRAEIESSNENIVTVAPAVLTESGTVSVTAVGRGEADIKVTFYGKDEAEEPYTITIPVTVAKPDIVLPALIVSTDAHMVKNGDYFRVNASFSGEVNSNTAVLNYSFDTSKFEYRGFTPAAGVGIVSAEATETGVKIILMIPNYDTKDYGEVLFSARDDAELKNEDCEISLNVDLVVISTDNIKEIQQVSAGTAFTTTDGKGSGGDGEYTLIDLSNIIDVFGIDNTHPDWNQHRFFDFNNNGEIDIDDISTLAQKI